jgi:ATP-binding cassette subfamily B protein RaxB
MWGSSHIAFVQSSSQQCYVGCCFVELRVNLTYKPWGVLFIGLYQPSGGEVLIDGKPIATIGTSALRRQLGLVMQEDQLLAGTISENIALFDEQIDLERVRLCAHFAAIDAEIMAFPMQYNSLVGDMGTTLSSGQKQRVLIARALYRKPKILVMDEGTAHLDPALEAKINEMLKSIPITRIVVAHSPAMMRAADRVLELRGGILREVKLDEPAFALPVTPGEGQEAARLFEVRGGQIREIKLPVGGYA